MKIVKKLIKFIVGIVLIVIILAVGLIVLLSITEFKPDQEMDLTIENNQSSKVNIDTEYSILTWNIGYAALGDNADFFMDGGKSVYSADKERIRYNLDGIKNKINENNPDFFFLQEVDKSSSRSYKLDEVAELSETYNNYGSNYAINYKTLFIPYPIPPLGKVNSGIMTFSKFMIEKSLRYSLPISFKWPVSLANLKRSLDVSYLPIEGSDKKLVLVNFHLEAYDSGEGKVAQTKVLVEFVENEYAKGNYVIAGGDFNQIFSSLDQEKYQVKEGLWAPGVIDVSLFTHFTPLMDDSIPTCRSLDQSYIGKDKTTFQYYLIDGLLISNNITKISLETLDYDFVYSDHNPVLLKFKLQ